MDELTAHLQSALAKKEFAKAQKYCEELELMVLVKTMNFIDTFCSYVSKLMMF